MSRTIWKQDDGIVDLILKSASIIAILVAAHQYYFKIYPVWAKEKELLTATYELERVTNETEALEVNNSKLQAEKDQLTAAISDLAHQKDEMTKNYEGQIYKLKESSERIRKELTAEKEALEEGLVKAVTKAQKLRIDAVSAHLRRITDQIFQIQLDHIRSMGQESELDLKRDVLRYISENKEESKSEFEKIAFEILMLYAENEIKDNTRTYTSISGVPIIFMHKSYAKKLIDDAE